MLALVEVLGTIASVLALIYSFLTPAGKDKLKAWLLSFLTITVSVAQPLLTAVEAELKPIVDAFVAAFNTYGPAMRDAVETPVAAVARDAFNVAAANLVLKGESTPDNAVQMAADAFAAAFGFGISSAAVTAAFEAAFPEKLNTLNGAGPMLAQLAGFAEISGAVREPLYRAAFGRSAEYHFRSVFKPELPDESDAVTWHARRLLNDDALRKIFGFSGLKAEYETPYIDSAYRTVPPFLLARAAEGGFIPKDDLVDTLRFGGYREQDITRLWTAYEALASQPYQNQYLAAAVRAAELGTLSDADLESAMTDIGLTPAMQHWVKLTVATRKLEQLAELYRKSISEAYQYGTIADADYVNALEAIGIAAADAQAHYAIDSIKKHGKEAAAIAREAAAAQKFTDRMAINAARADFREGIVNEVVLAARFAAAEMPPAAIPFAVEIEVQRKKLHKRWVFGALVNPDAAVRLREQVAALKEQRVKKAIDDAGALAELKLFGIPDANAEDLVAAWAAQADKTKLSIP